MDLTGIPAGTKRVTVTVNGVSTNGTSAFVIQLGDSGGFETTGYTGGLTTGTGQVANSTYFHITAGSQASHVWYGGFTLMKITDTGDSWLYQSNTGGTTMFNQIGAGTKTLTGELTQIRFTTAGGTNTFDLGSLGIAYEQ